MTAYDHAVKASAAATAAIQLLGQVQQNHWPDIINPLLDAARAELDVAHEAIKQAKRES